MKQKICSIIFLLSVIAMIFGCGKTDDINDTSELGYAESQGSGDFDERVTESLETSVAHESMPENPETKGNNTHESTSEEQTTETVTTEQTTISTTIATTESVAEMVTASTTERVTEAPITSTTEIVIEATTTEASTIETQSTDVSNDSTQEEENTSVEFTVNRSQPEGDPIPYSPQNVVSLAIEKCKAGGMELTSEHLDSLLAEGQITQEMYDKYYPTDGLGYYSVFIETDLRKASTISGGRLESEDAIASHLAGMLLLEKYPHFYIECAGVTNYHGEDLYEFRCYR